MFDQLRRLGGLVPEQGGTGAPAGTDAGDITFSKNYRDECVRSGTGAGFQFEFYCESCRDTWRSPFEPFRSGQGAGWVREAGSLAGSLLGSVGDHVGRAADGLADAQYGTSRDAAFRRAVESAKGHFHRCAECHDYVCDRCWNIDAGLCLRCAPDLAARVATERHRGLVEGATERAQDAGRSQSAAVDVTTAKQLVCPTCKTEARGGSFCPECGGRLHVLRSCGGCRAELPSGSKFCPECGTAASA